MPAPTIEAGKLKIYFEKPDSILINTIRPTCFLCGEDITVNDKVVVVIKATSTLRIKPDCFNVLVQGIAVTIKADQYMHIYGNDIQ